MSSGNRFKFEKFTLEIEMGNDAMRTPLQVSAAIGIVRTAIAAGRSDGIIRDVNGNTVGRWGFK